MIKKLWVVFLLLFCLDFMFAAPEFGYNYLDFGEQVIEGENYTINVNNSQYLQSYTWATNPYFSTWASTYNSSYVPYVGATNDVFLGSKSLNTYNLNITEFSGGYMPLGRVPYVTEGGRLANDVAFKVNYTLDNEANIKVGVNTLFPLFQLHVNGASDSGALRNPFTTAVFIGAGTTVKNATAALLLGSGTSNNYATAGLVHRRLLDTGAVGLLSILITNDTNRNINWSNPNDYALTFLPTGEIQVHKNISIARELYAGNITSTGSFIGDGKYLTGISTYNESYVPYTGATSNVDLGVYNMSTTGKIKGNLVSVYNPGGGLTFNNKTGMRVYDWINTYGTWLSASTVDGYIPDGEGEWTDWTDYWLNYYSQKKVFFGQNALNYFDASSGDIGMTGDLLIQDTLTNYTNLSVNSNGDLTIRTTGEDVIVLSNLNLSIYNLSTSKVYIGNPSGGADAKLWLKSNAFSQNQIKITNSLGNSLFLFNEDLDGDGAFTLYNSSGSGKIFFRTDTGNSYFNTGGNFGVGTTTPTSRLDVNGNISTSDSILNNADGSKHYFGAGKNVSMEWTGAYWKMMINNGLFFHNYYDPASVGSNIFIGVNSGNTAMAMTTDTFQASRNVGIGENTLKSLTSGYYNTAIGYNALGKATSAGSNFGLGYQALFDLASGTDNVAIGRDALQKTNVSSKNIGIGRNALNYNVGGSSNIALGYMAGAKYTGEVNLNKSTYSIFIGEITKASGNDQVNQIVIGYNATGRGTNTAVIGNDDTVGLYLGNNNYKLYFGRQANASITYDGANLVFETNRSGGDGLAWFSNNVSATGFITRTSVFDKAKSAKDYIKDAGDYLTEGVIDHEKFYGYTQFDVIDYSRPVVEYYDETFCLETDEDGKGKECTTEKKEKVTYPYTKIETGVDLGKEIDVLRQRLSEYDTCLEKSKSFEEYKQCLS